ncbi:MAG: helix-turn-helix domain-containing protein [Aestuariivirga sp.]
MKMKSYANVWDALEDSPEAAAAMTMRSDLMIALTEHVKSLKLTQAAAAKRLGVTQPRLNDMLRGRINNFSIDALITLARRAGLTVELKVKKAA